jgi:hypothetical protein
MKYDLKDSTFIIPLRIESDDRLRNIITVICYLLGNFNTKVIIKEVDEKSVFNEFALPQIKEFLDGDINNLQHIFEKSDSNDHVFYRMKYLNEMIDISNTKVIVNYDCDVLLSTDTCLTAQDMLVNGDYDVIYPYGCGNWQKMIFADDELVSEFLSNDFNFSFLEKKSQMQDAKYGHVQFFKISSYIEGGMENENFKGSSPDDFERFYRFSNLGYNVGRIDGYVYHLEHSRGKNSWPVSYNENPHMQENLKLWEMIQKMSKDELEKYYSSQEYLNKYRRN